MTDSRRLFLSIFNGLILLSAGLFAVWKSTEPTVTVVDTPILTAATPDTTTSTAGQATETTVVDAQPAAATRPVAPVAPPRNEYAPEPVLEIGSIEIPKIGLRHQVFHGITMRNIDRGPSHWPGTALPGEVGNSVFAGHRVTKTHPFRNIHQLVPGDEVFFTVNPATFGAEGQPVRTRYVVTGHEIVPPTALRIVDPTPTATATLFACHPPGSARYRYVVRLELANS
ncbi:MAG TPA: class E sortase [Acidimicrobiales bacterium]|jgi:sortase A|nr:class E sortase [Acidimicrobiales bacterium]